MTTSVSNWRWGAAIGLILVTAIGCGVGLQSEKNKDGAECTTSDDCEEGLECRNFICTSPSSADTDSDGIANEDDNCPDAANPNQTNSDLDAEGDACDTDDDNDGVLDDDDNCVTIANADQRDRDGDGLGDACDPENPPECDCTDLQTCDEATGTCIEPTVCLSDGDCIPPRICLAGACTDEEPECRDDYDCDDDNDGTPDGYCDPIQLQCIPNICTNDSQCLGSLVCNADGWCSDCSATTPCPGNQVCDYFVCLDAEAGQCTNDTDCAEGRICDIDTGNCIAPPCQADTFEPNEGMSYIEPPVECDEDAECSANAFCDFGFCAEIQSTASTPTGVSNITLCADDEGLFDQDWFLLDLTPGDGLIIQASYDPEHAFIQMAINDAAGQPQILGTEDIQGTILLGIPEVTSDHVYLQFLVFNGFMVPLSFEVTVIPGGFCLEDDSESNNTQDTAHAINNDPVSEFKALTFCDDTDVDWFKFDMSAGRTLDLEIATASGTPPMVEVYAGDTLIKKDTTSRATKNIEHEVTEAGTYWVKLYSTTVGSQFGGEARFHSTLTAR